MNKTAAVVVTYNRKKLLRECIESLLRQTTPCDIVIIDNNSNDGTREYILELIKNKNIIYRNTGENLGGAGGFHYGIKLAVRLGYEYLWIMDDDCEPRRDALSQFFSADRELHGNYGFLSGKVLWKDGSICKMNVQRKTVTKNVTDFSKPLIPIEMASFVSLFVPSKIIRELGLPIKDFFIWTDDWEFTRRISKKYKCLLVTKSVVTHKSQNNRGADISYERSERLPRYDYLYRNDVYLYRREGIKGFIYEACRLSEHILRIIFKARDNRLKRIKYVIAGTKKGLKFFPKIEYVDEGSIK